ncbi:unsaturated disaccharide hydrolase [Acrasis kona]|uniref:Unsaturated disaccharide hydrolase n=1 Tax=Acrasis kona TaxID=1008807 RepID=A0AAW2ZFC5_9EUKA
MIKLFCCIAVLLYITASTSCNLSEDILKFADAQLTNTVKITQGGLFANNTLPSGKWTYTSSGAWTSGFYTGCLWYMYALTNDTKWLERAKATLPYLSREQYNKNTHDIGFIIFNSFGLGYKLTQDQNYHSAVLNAAAALSTRYSSKVKCTKSWNWSDKDFPVIIDNMMNLELLFWAAENGGRKEFKEIAINHADTTDSNHFRKDGSSYHVINYNPDTGLPKFRGTHQGYSDNSTWSRGQAWAIYGYTMSYRFTKSEKYLKRATISADYYIRRLPNDYVAYWDFDAPEIPKAPRDTSGAAVAASGLIELSSFVSGEAKEKYLTAAKKIISSLTGHDYLARDVKGFESILTKGTPFKKANLFDIGIIYGDYYLLECLYRLKNL